MFEQRSGKRSVLLALAIGFASGAIASEPPDSEINFATGDIESVDTIEESGIRQIRHVTDPGQGAPAVAFLLTTSPSDDRSPRIAIEGSGRARVTWWRDGAEDVVLLRTRDLQTGLWSAEQRVSEPGESSRNPEIVTDGTGIWLAFEYDAPGGGTGIGVSSIFDDPEPFPTRRPVETTSYAGDVDVLAHAEGGKVWISWVHSAIDVGWSRYDAATDTWSVTALESYLQDDVGAARERIRTQILGN